jgi:hypothetical protein
LISRRKKGFQLSFTSKHYYLLLFAITTITVVNFYTPLLVYFSFDDLNSKSFSSNNQFLKLNKEKNYPVNSFKISDKAFIDSDLDGLSDREENYYYGTNPNLADTDNDSLTDYFEATYNCTLPRFSSFSLIENDLVESSIIDEELVFSFPLINYSFDQIDIYELIFDEIERDYYFELDMDWAIDAVECQWEFYFYAGYYNSTRYKFTNYVGINLFDLNIQFSGHINYDTSITSGGSGPLDLMGLYRTNVKLQLIREGYSLTLQVIDNSIVLKTYHPAYAYSPINCLRIVCMCKLKDYCSGIVTCNYINGTCFLPILNPLSNDTDSDLLTDGQEILGIYSPSNPGANATGYVHTNPLVSDTDSDGLFDREEVLIYGTNPLNNDTDGDGWSDIEEIQRGKNPNDPNNYPDKYSKLRNIIISGVIIITLIIIPILITYSRKKPGKKILFDSVRTPRDQVSLKEPQVKANSLIFDKKLGTNICLICKLELENNEECFQCSYCQSFFHKEHLLQWLKSANSCPFCGQILTN